MQQKSNFMNASYPSVKWFWLVGLFSSLHDISMNL